MFKLPQNEQRPRRNWLYGRGINPGYNIGFTAAVAK
jgi:hypothetical protein